MHSLYIVGILLLFIALMFLQAYWEHRRTQAIEAIAPQLGLQFRGNGHDRLPSVVRSFDLFSKGRSRRVRHVLAGRKAGTDVFLFDYQYTTGSRKHRRTHTYTVALLWLNNLEVPAFSLSPKNLFHVIGSWFGRQDINFDGYPLFSQHYLLQGSDEPSIRRIFNPEVFSFYESRNNACTEGLGNVLIYYYTGGRVEPKYWPGLLSSAQNVAGLFSRSDAF